MPASSSMADAERTLAASVGQSSVRKKAMHQRRRARAISMRDRRT
jgi:hypothetical protein